MKLIPVVSVLVTVFNREAYLAATLDSILASSFQDFEVIVVDDASLDGSLAIANRYQRQDSRVRVFTNASNLGDYANRNRAAAEALGNYLKYVDADDLLYAHSLEIMVKAMESAPSAGLGLSWNVIDPPCPYPFVSTPEEVYRAHYLGKSVLGVGPSAAIIRRSAFEAIGGFSGTQFIGDAELWLRLAARWPVVSLPPSLVWWRRHEGQQMSIEQSRPEVLNFRYQMECNGLADCGLLSETEKRLGRARLSYRHGRRLFSMAVRERRPGPAFQLWRRAGLSARDFFRCFWRAF